MALSPHYIATFQIINDEFFHLKEIEKLKSVNESLQEILRNNLYFQTKPTFIAYLTKHIRTPLYTFFISDDLIYCNREQINSIFNILMVLAWYWPISTKCCIPNPNANAETEEIPLQNRALFLSGHVAGISALEKFWEEQRVYRHPVYQNVVSAREVLWVFREAKFPDSAMGKSQDLYSTSTIKNKLKTDCSDKVIYLFGFLAIILIALVATAFFSVPLIAAIAASPPTIANIALAGTLGGLSVIIGGYTAYLLHDKFCDWVAEQQYNEIEYFKKEVDIEQCEAAKARNSATISLIKLVDNVRESIKSRLRAPVIPNTNLSATTLVPTPDPTPAPSSSQDESTNNISSSPRTDWEKTGFHAVTASTSTVGEAKEKEDSSEELLMRGLNQGSP